MRMLDSEDLFLENIEKDGPVFFNEIYRELILENTETEKWDIVDNYFKLYLSGELTESKPVAKISEYVIENLDNYILINMAHIKLADGFKIFNNVVTNVFENFRDSPIPELVEKFKSFLNLHNDIVNKSVHFKENAFSRIFNTCILHMFDNFFWNDDIKNFNAWIADDCKMVFDFVLYLTTLKPEEDVIRIFVMHVSETFNMNVSKINLETPDKDVDDVDSDFVLMKMHNIAFLLLEKELAHKDISEIDYNYITDKNCLINWYVANNHDIIDLKTNYNILTQLFFVVLNSIRIFYIPVINRYNKYPDLIDQMQIFADTVLSSGGAQAEAYAYSIYGHKQTLIEMSKEINLIVNEFMKFDTKMADFYNIVSKWIRNYAKGLDVNDILREMSAYLNFYIENDLRRPIYDMVMQEINCNEEDKDKESDEQESDQNSEEEQDITEPEIDVLYCEKSIIKLALQIIRTQEFTSSISIRYMFAKNMKDYFLELSFGEFHYNRYMTAFIEGLVIIHNDVDACDDTLYSKLMAKMNIYNLLLGFLNKDKKNDNDDYHKKIIHTQFSNNSIQNLEINLRFISIVASDINELTQFMNDTFDELKNCKHKPGTDKYKKIARNVYEIFSLYNKHTKFIMLMLDIDSFVSLCKDQSVLSTIAIFMNICVYHLVENIKFNFDFTGINDKTKLSNQINAHSIALVAIIHRLFNINSIFIKMLKEDTKTYKLDNYKELSAYVMSLTCEGSGICNNIAEIVEELEKEDENETYITDMPDEFLDPLMFIPIKDPIMLPVKDNNIDMILEKSCLVKQLLINGENPFNREPLTLEDVEKYNEQESVKEKIKSFNDKLLSWKSTNIIKK